MPLLLNLFPALLIALGAVLMSSMKGLVVMPF
jgi:hypothetical protein